MWFYKFLDLDENEKNMFKPREKEKGGAYDIIKRKYEELGQTQQTQKMLEACHLRQMAFLEAFQKRYVPLVFHTRLKSRLISGLGYSHPTGTGITLDHNLGVPYLPAASIKGLVRAARRFEMGYMDDKHDADPDSLMPTLFGNQKTMGRVIFLDAYPVKPPKMEIEILTPHYRDYYNNKTEWPGDWMDPVPIKFMAVAAGTEYVFRALVDKEYSTPEMLTTIKETYHNALCVLGVGGKTAVGYGNFEIVGQEESPELHAKMTQWMDKQRSPEEKKERARRSTLDKLEQQTDANLINNLFNDWQADPNLATDKIIATAFKSKLRQKKNSGEWTAPYKTVCEILGETPEDEPGINIPQAPEEPGIAQDQLEKDRKKLERYIAKGSITKKEFKKLRHLKNHLPELYEQVSKRVK